MSGLTNGNDIGKLSTTLYSQASATTATTIVAPAANTNGVRINSINSTVGGGAANRAFFIGLAAPASVVDVTANKHIIYSILAATGQVVIDKTPMPFIVPPGYGIYDISNAVAASYSHMNYQVL